MNRFLLASLFACFVSVACAIPARRTPRIVNQPDGTQVTVIKQGDEYYHFYTTTDNIALCKGTDGYFYYALTDQNGNLYPSELLAHDSNFRTEADQQFINQKEETSIRISQVARQIRKDRQPNIRTYKADVLQTGSPKIPIILIEYSDVKFSEKEKAHENYTKRISTRHYSEGKVYGSVTDYFFSQSNGKFTPEFDIIGPVTLNHPRAYYGAHTETAPDIRPAEMVRDACDMAKKQGLIPDFSIYDNNGDGVVDVIYTIYAGVGEASSDVEESVWPHQHSFKYAFPDEVIQYDNVILAKYACNNELYTSYPENKLEIDGIGTFCHEFSHCLGLPDFYDTKYSYTGMYVWDVMDMGLYNGDGHIPCGYSAYEKNFMGWLDLTELTEKASIELPALHSENEKAYRITNPNDANEYFILENRQQTGWDSGILGHGMLVFHVTYDQTAWESNRVNDFMPQRMTLVPADKSFIYQHTARPDTTAIMGDPFPGITQNTALTSLKVNTGSPIKKAITGITETDGSIYFQFMGGVLTTPYLKSPTNISPVSFTANWEKAKEADGYTLLVKKVADTNTNEQADKNTTKEIYVEGNLNSYTVTGLDEKALYTYQIKSHLGNNTSRYSDTMEVDLSTGTSIDHISTSAVSIRTTTQGILVNTDSTTPIYIYTHDGMLKHQSMLNTGENTINLTPGIYLVKTENSISKVIVCKQ